MIEIRYAGVVVGRSSIVRELDTRGLFLGVTEPLPVGTAVELKIGDRVVPGRVENVSEAQELARAGMRVRFAQSQDAVIFGTPVEAPAELAPPLWFSNQPSPPHGAVSGSSSAGDASAVPDVAASPSPSGPRRIVVDASSEKPPEAAIGAAALAPGDALDGELSGPEGSSDGRIPAPDPSAFGAGAMPRKNRRNRRR